MQRSAIRAYGITADGVIGAVPACARRDIILKSPHELSNASAMQPEWYYATGGVPHGPISIEEVGRRLTQDGFPADALVWHESFEKWERPDVVPELRRKHKGVTARASKKAEASPIKSAARSRWRPWIGMLFLVAIIAAAVAGYKVHSELADLSFLGWLRPQEGETNRPQEAEATRTEEPEMLREEADMKRKLPLRVDQVTTLVDIRYEPTGSSYWYVLDGRPDEFDRFMLKDLTQRSACANAEILRLITQRGFSYEYYYATKDGSAVAQFRITACP